MSLRIKVLTLIPKTLRLLPLSSLISLPFLHSSRTGFLAILQTCHVSSCLRAFELVLTLLLSQIVVWFTHPPPTGLDSNVTFSLRLSLDTLFKITNWPTFPSPYLSPLPYFLFLHSIYHPLTYYIFAHFPGLFVHCCIPRI